MSEEERQFCYSCGRDIEGEPFMLGQRSYHRDCAHSYDPMIYRLGHGTVQPIVIRVGDHEHSMFLHHFGHPVYDGRQPILSESCARQARRIVIGLNDGTITEDEARAMLDKIRF